MSRNRNRDTNVTFVADIILDFSDGPKSRMDREVLHEGESLVGLSKAHVLANHPAPVEAFDLELVGGRTYYDIPYAAVIVCNPKEIFAD